MRYVDIEDLKNNPDKFVEDLKKLENKMMTTTDINEVEELKNHFIVLDHIVWSDIVPRILRKEGYNKYDVEILKLIMNSLIQMHKIKHGTKHIIKKIDYKDVAATFKKQMKEEGIEIEAIDINDDTNKRDNNRRRKRKDEPEIPIVE